MKKGFLKKVLSATVVTSLVFVSAVSAVADTPQAENKDFTLSIDKQIEATRNLNISIQANDSPQDKPIDLNGSPFTIVEKDASFTVTPKMGGRNLMIDLSLWRETSKDSGIFKCVEILNGDSGFFEEGRTHTISIFPEDTDESNSIAMLWIYANNLYDEPYRYCFTTKNLSALKGVTASINPTVQNPTLLNPIIAKSTNSMILVNEKKVEFEAYNINGNNYFKLRDLAKALSGTEKQFDVKYDNDLKQIQLVGGKAYDPVGGELAKGDGNPKEAKLSDQRVIRAGTIVNFEAYNINGNNYFKLRDISKHFNFGVIYDDATKTVGIDTSISYTE